MRKTSRYYCSSCNQGFVLEEDYDDACPYCGEYQLECVDFGNNEDQLPLQPEPEEYNQDEE